MELFQPKLDLFYDLMQIDIVLTYKQILGQKGERMAEQFLSEKGCKIIQRNYRHKRSEVDLIIKDGQFLVFAEVKTRKSIAYGNPEEAVSEKKAQKIIEAADEYILEKKWKGPIRFDIMSIIISGDKTEIKWFKDAFY